MTDLDQLRRHLLGLGRVLLGYSGGVDSAFLAVVASRALGTGRFLAVIGRSPSYPEAQWRTAVELAERYGVPLHELDTPVGRDEALHGRRERVAGQELH